MAIFYFYKLAFNIDISVILLAMLTWNLFQEKNNKVYAYFIAKLYFQLIYKPHEGQDLAPVSVYMYF